VLTVFVAVCQAFFMGMFFLLAGYFTPSSFDRKGVKSFVIDRLLRLGIPLLVYGFLIGTATSALARMNPDASFIELWLRLLNKGTFNYGPLWFAQALLIFTAGYIAWRLLAKSSSAKPDTNNIARPIPGHRVWVAAAVAVGIGALLLRNWFPLGHEIAGITLGYFSSYIFLFVLGCVAWQYRWLERIERKHAVTWGWIALAAFPVLPVVGVVTGRFSGDASKLAGGWAPADVVYAFWEPFMAWGIIALLLWQFRVRFNHPSARWDGWAANAYGAYIVHAPVVVALCIGLRDWSAPTIIKFTLVSCAAITISFSIARVLKMLPGANRVL
jgi:surface polysaccharide O-acyltransferase-like enzyme